MALIASLLVFLLMSKLVDINPSTKTIDSVSYNTISIHKNDVQGSAIKQATLSDAKQEKVVTQPLTKSDAIALVSDVQVKEDSATIINKSADSETLGHTPSPNTSDVPQQTTATVAVALINPSSNSTVETDKALKPQESSTANSTAKPSNNKNQTSNNASINESSTHLKGNLARSNSTQNSQVKAIPVSRVEPSYPRNARRRKIEGYVLLEFNVSNHGITQNIQVLDSSPKNIFDKAAVEAVSKWKYKSSSSIQNFPAQQVRLAFKLR
ncbi:TonB family protein [Alginatibacterium sediminis]|uniref:TonB family protein n=1 Tax=Alginatibacterium sediminis TaxID=2164068 RepID=UPI001314524C|nr:TonB family protein [Alginatibacterium sediminis]